MMAKNKDLTTNWLTEDFTKEELLLQKLLSDISAIIQKQRKALGLSQVELADILGVSQGIISRRENGEENLTLETISKIAVALDLSIQSPIVIPSTCLEYKTELAYEAEAFNNFPEINYNEPRYVLEGKHAG